MESWSNVERDLPPAEADQEGPRREGPTGTGDPAGVEKPWGHVRARLAVHEEKEREALARDRNWAAWLVLLIGLGMSGLIGVTVVR